MAEVPPISRLQDLPDPALEAILLNTNERDR